MKHLATTQGFHGTGREFNHLKISNLDQFFSEYQNNGEPYRPPFAILADLEQQILFKDEPEKTILVRYIEGGYIIFDLVRIDTTSYIRTVTYQYSSSVS